MLFGKTKNKQKRIVADEIIQTSWTGGQPYTDTTPWEVNVYYLALSIELYCLFDSDHTIENRLRQGVLPLLILELCDHRIGRIS